MTTTAYDELTKTLAVILVHEDNDDVQEIEVGQGKADTECIGPGVDGVLDTTPVPDDEKVGETITNCEYRRYDSIYPGVETSPEPTEPYTSNHQEVYV